MVKNLYKGVFNYPHRLYIIRRAAYSVEQAKLLMARALADKQGVFINTVFGWMNDNVSLYKIQTEIEWTEEDNANQN